jgi:hypothetical protein
MRSGEEEKPDALAQKKSATREGCAEFHLKRRKEETMHTTRKLHIEIKVSPGSMQCARRNCALRDKMR